MFHNIRFKLYRRVNEYYKEYIKGVRFGRKFIKVFKSDWIPDLSLLFRDDNDNDNN